MSLFKQQKYDRLLESDEEAPPEVQLLTNHDSNRWSQIQNLDDFFTRTYNYHRNNGFWCMVINEFLQLLQFAFVVFFVLFLTCCVDYDKLGQSDPNILDAIDWSGLHKIHGFVALMVLVAVGYWSWNCAKFVWNTSKYLEIKIFYRDVLKIPEDTISNLEWTEVQARLIESQKQVQLCLHKDTLTELDVSNRILRMDNYKVAMINKKVLPYSFNFPIMGQRVFLPKMLMVNLEFILFNGPRAPFKSSWKLDERYKRRDAREHLAERLSAYITYLAAVNLLLMPILFVWQLIFQIVHYAELVKREPGILGVRMWSLYARYFLRHYNELCHEFDARLKKAYIPANKFMNLFTSPMLVIIAKNIGFFAGAILLVLVSLTLINEELLFADHIPLAITLLGITVSVCKALIPDANQVFCPDVLMKEVLLHTHYQPDNWNNAAQLPHVREEFGQMFLFKGVYLAEELIAPLITPFILYFNIRHRSLDFVDFLRNYTVSVVGVGDVCSFSQMDIKRHGNPDWMAFGMTNGPPVDQAEHGKTELSLINFSIRNPDWKPKDSEAMYISTIRALAKQDSEGMGGSLISQQHGMARSLIQGSSPMLASMNLPHFQPTVPISAPSSSETVTGDHLPTSSNLYNEEIPTSSHHTDHHQSQYQIEEADDSEEGPPTLFGDEGPPTLFGGPEEMLTSVNTKQKYIFDDQYNQMEQSYRESGRRPVTESMTVPPESSNRGGVLHDVIMTSSYQPTTMDMMSMSTVDASLFMSAHMEHSQWAARSSLSTGDVKWTGVRKEYREMARSTDLGSSALFLHSLHSRLKQQEESPQDMMTRSLHGQIHSDSRQQMSKSYPNNTHPNT